MNRITLSIESNDGINDFKPGKKKMLVLGIIIVTLVCALAIILPVLFLVILRSSTTTAVSTTTSIPPKVISAYWTFDQTATDSYGIHNGSFTVESWIYATNTSGNRGIISQCACSTCSNQCFYLILRSGRLYADFMFNGLFGATTILVNTCYHVAFVYNYATNQQILYVKGVQDGIISNAPPYQGTSASLQIGAGPGALGIYCFHGYIDHVRLTTRAKSSTEILFDASVSGYYSFNVSSGNNDNGPNGLTGQLIVQGYGWPWLYGPFLTVNTWMHVSVTYSIANGMTLYINGVRSGSTGSYSFGTQNYISWIQIGYNNQFSCGSMANNGFQGSIDELYVHSCELTQTDITALANP